MLTIHEFRIPLPHISEGYTMALAFISAKEEVDMLNYHYLITTQSNWAVTMRLKPNNEIILAHCHITIQATRSTAKLRYKHAHADIHKAIACEL